MTKQNTISNHGNRRHVPMRYSRTRGIGHAGMKGKPPRKDHQDLTDDDWFSRLPTAGARLRRAHQKAVIIQVKN